MSETKILISGVKPYDGEYELDVKRAFNTHEWNIIKTVSGYLPLTVNEGLKGEDPSLFVALAVIALCRNQKVDRANAIKVADLIADAPVDGTTIQFTFAEDEDDGDAVDPPALASVPAA